MKKIVCLILILFNLFFSCEAKNAKFIQVTDVHLTSNNFQYLQQFVEDVNKNYKDIDFIVFTGDNIDNANSKDLELFLDIINNLKIKPYVLVGNHDLFKSNSMSKENYMCLVQKKLGLYHSNKPNYVFKDKDIVFIAMNGVKEVIPSSKGYYRQDELIWLDKMLSKYSNKKVVILQHFPLLTTIVKGHNMYGRENYEQILKKHTNVISIISGHYHENREQKDGEIYHIITKNFSNNKYYKIIEIDTDNNMVYTLLIDNNKN